MVGRHFAQINSSKILSSKTSSHNWRGMVNLRKPNELADRAQFGPRQQRKFPRFHGWNSADNGSCPS